MGVFKQWATNKKLEVEGIRLTYAPNPDGTVPTLIVRRVYRESPKYQAIFTRVTKPYKNAIENEEISEADDARLMQRVFVEAAVIGWENWRMPEGVAGGRGEGRAYALGNDNTALPLDAFQHTNGERYDMPYSTESCCAVMAVVPDLWKDAAYKAGDPDTYKSVNLRTWQKTNRCSLVRT